MTGTGTGTGTGTERSVVFEDGVGTQRKERPIHSRTACPPPVQIRPAPGPCAGGSQPYPRRRPKRPLRCTADASQSAAAKGQGLLTRRLQGGGPPQRRLPRPDPSTAARRPLRSRPRPRLRGPSPERHTRLPRRTRHPPNTPGLSWSPPVERLIGDARGARARNASGGERRDALPEPDRHRRS